MKAKTLLVLTGTLLLASCGNKTLAKFETAVDASLTKGLETGGEGTFSIRFQGENLTKEGEHKSYYGEATHTYWLKNNKMLVHKDGNPEFFFDIVHEKVYKFDSEDQTFKLINTKPDNVNCYGLDYGYPTAYLRFNLSYDLKEELITETEENKFTFTSDSTSQNRVYHIELRDHDGELLIDKFDLTFNYSTNTIMRYWVEMESYSCTFPTDIALPE